jgi:1-acyl-sn-glycerol-3-phosphate acyltransferase
MGLALRIFARRIRVNRPGNFKKTGPLLLAVNHPNSFLDAIILDILFEEPIWSLARGDAFKTALIKKLMRAIKTLPVYRVSEGVENLEENYQTFDACKNIFRQNGIVLIFSEGKCINEWHLRSLKKGTARLAFSCWKDNIPLTVLPIGLNYNSFRKTGKNIFINIGQPIVKEDFPDAMTDGRANIFFNERLEDELEKLVYEIPADNLSLKKELLEVKISMLKKILLAIPAVIGYALNFPFSFPVKSYVKFRTKNTDHFDSVCFAVFAIFYPFYLLAVTAIIFAVTHSSWSLLTILILPLTAKAWIEIKHQLD